MVRMVCGVFFSMTYMTDDPEKKHERFIDHLTASGYIQTEPVRNAFLKIMRRDFLPDSLKNSACQDYAIAVKYRHDGPEPECSSSCSQPSLTAMMLEWLEILPGMSVLDIGTGTGYTAALLCEMTGTGTGICSMDSDEELVDSASRKLQQYGFRPQLKKGDALREIPFPGRFDRFLVTAGVPHIPDYWYDHLSPDAGLVLPFYWGGIDYVMTLRLETPNYLAGHCRLFTVFTGLSPTRDRSRALEIDYCGNRLTLFDFFPADNRENPVFSGIRHEFQVRISHFPGSPASDLEGFHIFTLVTRPFFHGGLQLAHSITGFSGFSGYALYAYDPDHQAIVIFPFNSGMGKIIVINETNALLKKLEKIYKDWEQLGSPRLTDYRIRFIRHDSDYRDSRGEGWYIRKETNHMHITF